MLPATKEFDCTESEVPLFAVIPVTDCKSLYDAIKKCSPQLQERKTMVDRVSIKRSSGDSVRRVPTWQMWADALTKRDAKLNSTICSPI